MTINLNARRPEVRAALEALTDLPDQAAVGCWMGPDGTPGRDLTVAEVRQSLLDGTNTLTPEQITGSITVRLLRQIVTEDAQHPTPSDPALDG